MSSMPSLDELSNWIPDTNRYNLPKPPAWFLKVLWDLDSALVVFPSRQGKKYLLARRRSQSKLMATVLHQTFSEKQHKRVKYSDGDMLESRKCVLVDSITSITGDVFNASWMTSTPKMMQDLRDRDMWAAGGAEKYIEKLEAREKAEADRKRATLESNLEHRAADAYRSYQARTGQRTRIGPGISRTSRAKIVQVGTL